MVVMVRGAAGAAFVMNVPIAMPMLYDMALAGAMPAAAAAAPAAAAVTMPPMPAAAWSIADAYAGGYASTGLCNVAELYMSSDQDMSIYFLHKKIMLISFLLLILSPNSSLCSTTTYRVNNNLY